MKLYRIKAEGSLLFDQSLYFFQLGLIAAFKEFEHDCVWWLLVVLFMILVYETTGLSA